MEGGQVVIVIIEKIGHRDGFMTKTSKDNPVNAQMVELAGKPYVLLPRGDYEKLKTLAKVTDLPGPDQYGNLPAVPYARASMAKSIIQDRVKLGLSQKELANKAGIRVETLCRIENGRHTASVSTIEKIDRVLKPATTTRKSRSQRQRRKAG